MSTRARRGWFLRLAEGVFDFNARWGGRQYKLPAPPRHAGNLFMIPIDVHRIEPSCLLLTGSGAAGEIAVDRQTVFSRSNRRVGDLRTLVYRIFAALVCSLLVGYAVWVVGMTIADLLEPGGVTTFHVFVGIPLVLLFVTFILYLTLANVGQQACIVHAVDDWAEVLDGTSGTSDSRPVADWLAHYWPWYTPPGFLSAETAWAIGARNGQPLLVSSERSDSSLVTVGLTTFRRILATGEHHGLDQPALGICRLSLFLPGRRLKGIGGEEMVRELYDWGYGVVPIAAGIYVYGKADERGLRPQFLGAVLDKVMSASDGLPARPLPNMPDPQQAG